MPLSRERSPLAGEGEKFKYAKWLRRLRRASGVYIIVGPRGGVLYVGESHSGTLYDTITRHFQRWDGPTAGTTYDPGKVRVAVERTARKVAPSRQAELIRELDPRDNVAFDDGPEDEPADPSDFQDE